jgi:hypothetical protein
MEFRLVRNGVAVIAAIVTMLASAASWQPADLCAKDETYPREVLIIRHAEKPPEESKSVDLNAEGKQRADALPQLFKATPNRADPFPTPDFIFAAKNSKHSYRSMETVMPLARKLNRPINSVYANEDFPKLAEEILHNSKYAGKTILIAWHHGNIPQLAEKLKATGTPDHWKGTAFDRVWRITYDSAGKATFNDLPQQLMPRDSQK